MVLNIAHGHPTGVQGDDHVIKLRQTAGAFRQHPRRKRASSIPGHSHIKGAVARVDGFGVRPVAVIATIRGAQLGFRRTIRVRVS
ncbi:hypothetical protein FRC0206_02283 [Corynebacterium diphtheriae]|nr:hypothetical protein FRC0206_02283 [Corynebacterium diphtheriae]